MKEPQLALIDVLAKVKEKLPFEHYQSSKDFVMMFFPRCVTIGLNEIQFLKENGLMVHSMSGGQLFCRRILND